MSRIGKQPVIWADGTKVSMSAGVVTVETSKGKLTQDVDPCITIAIDDSTRTATLTRAGDTGRERALHGLYRSLVANMVEGLEKGYEKQLEIQGVGYNAKLQGQKLVLNIGFNAPVEKTVPADIDCAVPDATHIHVKGADKQKVGQFAAEIRRLRPPEPYKGKGIRYVGEYVRRKVGKSLGA